MVKNIFLKLIVEDGKNAKNHYVGKSCLVHFFKFPKKLSSTQILASEKGPKSMHFLMQNFVIKLEKIDKEFPDFNYNLQQYSLFIIVFVQGLTVFFT